jgi:NAD-dependent DNA ligase
VYDDLFVQISATVPELNRLRAAKLEAVQNRDQSQESKRKEIRDLGVQIETFRQKNGQLEHDMIEAEKGFNMEKRRLLDDKDQVAQELETFREDAFIAEARLQSKISKFEERIRQMTEKDRRSLKDTDADGEIVYADQGLGMGWIDLGRDDRLRRGLTFEVFQYIKGGKRKTKGFIEVKRIDDETSQVSILSQTDPTDPIVKGDYVASPFFDKKKDMVFVFIGERLTNDRYDRVQLERRIHEFGGRVDEAISIDTDFAIAIKNAEQDDAFAKAVQFGVILMRESELLDFIGQ